jgi:hypothetical protein
MQEKEIVIFVVVIVVVIILLNRKNEQENFVWTGYPGRVLVRSMVAPR